MRRFSCLWTVLLLAACGREVTPPIPHETFVAVMVELRQTAAQGDSAGFPQRRAEILRQAGVTEAELRSYVEVVGRRPERLRESFDSISVQLQRSVVPE